MFWKRKPENETPAPESAAVSEAARAVTPVPSSATPAAPPAAASVSPAAFSETSAPASETPHDPGAPLETGRLREEIIEQLRTVYDPEIPVNIYELGLVYKIDVDADGRAKIEMTLTSPACPSAAEIPADVRRKAELVPGIRSAEVEIVWDPPWTMEFMSEAARVQLGFF